MTKEFNNLEEIEKYYNKETNTYVFNENGKYIDLVVFDFDLNVEANIKALDINACDIDAMNINSMNINSMNIDACDIKANDISYYAICVAYKDIRCKSIKGIRENAKHFVLNGVLEVLEND